ncbi:MAG: NifB/NifX family molybdenum-iron cluster-binding protein [Candidatus Omnitrophica bacterium]|nr:NifB/NifX family molybdenum-iron cluster-binding protein [Candidatus Omnitrophota bacterium]
MRYAIAKDGNLVSAHFGRCMEYVLLDVENGQISNEQVVANPGHAPGNIPDFLNSHRVNVVIAGGMGARAVQFFKQFGMDTVVGVAGTLSEVKKMLTEGALKGGESTCSPKSGRGYGLERQGGCHHDE